MVRLFDLHDRMCCDEAECAYPVGLQVRIDSTISVDIIQLLTSMR